MKIVGLDIGDRWVGIAISDEIGLTTRPYTTVEIKNLISSLRTIIDAENIQTIIVGYPKTMGGKESEQTKKLTLYFEELKQQFPSSTWVLWDERMTSKQAAQLKKTKTKEEKLKSHAIAAALILKTYLDYLDFQKNI